MNISYIQFSTYRENISLIPCSTLRVNISPTFYCSTFRVNISLIHLVHSSKMSTLPLEFGYYLDVKYDASQ